MDWGVLNLTQPATSFVIRSVPWASAWRPEGSNQLIRGFLNQARAQRSFVRGSNLKEKNAARALIVIYTFCSDGRGQPRTLATGPIPSSNERRWLRATAGAFRAAGTPS